eukprot:630020-Amorphochlora_amoeboformis.AAC.1
MGGGMPESPEPIALRRTHHARTRLHPCIQGGQDSFHTKWKPDRTRRARSWPCTTWEVGRGAGVPGRGSVGCSWP